MKRTFVVAIAATMGVAGYAETAPRAQAAESVTSPRSLDAVRANALAEMRDGNLMEVGKRGWRGGKRAHGRHWRGGRNWRGGRHYGSRRYYGGRRYYHRRHHGHGAAVAAGIAGLAIGAMAADANARAHRSYRGGSKQWCANRYRSYDWRTGTFMGYDGVRRRCP